jgi:cyclophilin family peptidyl-prolyl cis-trans isomerase
MSRTRHSAKTERQLERARRARWTRLLGIGAAFIIAAAIFWGFGLGPKISKLFVAKAHRVTQYDSAPPITIDVKKQYYATVKMAKGGEFVIELYAARAPVTVNSFVFLARNGFYDGTTFHRVLEGFMAQGGDPTGTGKGGPGYQFANEDNGLLFDKPGVVAMANSGRDTNGSQFFITFAAADWLNGGYTIFGQVTSGMDVVNGLTLRDPNQNPDYPGDKIESITIAEQ